MLIFKLIFWLLITVFRLIFRAGRSISDKITTRAKRPVPQPLKALLTLVCVSAVLAATYFGSTTIFQIIIYTIYYTQVGHPAPAPE
ncbi:MAG: hypothetical protein B5766_00335 [Candidatus Lumbricidophila eiseniae]|uniref:Uncharacterized protein n=1 Tax=Candidatus Lumbricidiphila eiseniae TaxID=1969409 RepID=A0A2A6FV62_9MICO|nr:MAG: hypothetical protein B5766_00335 [Candidatus Lumbricidophila eiseniae]